MEIDPEHYNTLLHVIDQRDHLAITLMKMLAPQAWKSMKDDKGASLANGAFIAGIFVKPGIQVSFILSVDELWGKTDFIRELPQAPAYDGHTYEDIIKRLEMMRAGISSSPARSNDHTPPKAS